MPLPKKLIMLIVLSFAYKAFLIIGTIASIAITIYHLFGGELHHLVITTILMYTCYSLGIKFIKSKNIIKYVGTKPPPEYDQ